MIESFSVTELVGLFRAGLLALLPTMDRARIPWHGESVYDPWEDIERTLYQSIIGSCVENAVRTLGLMPLASYGLVLPSYAERSFLTTAVLSGGAKIAAFLQLATASNPFDQAVFVELDDATLTPTENRFRCSALDTIFKIATSTSGGLMACYERIDYEA